MRFIAKWNNGIWKVFDTELFRDVTPPRKLGTRREAEEYAAQCNGPVKAKR